MLAAGSADDDFVSQENASLRKSSRNRKPTKKLSYDERLSLTERVLDTKSLEESDISSGSESSALEDAEPIVIAETRKLGGQAHPLAYDSERATGYTIFSQLTSSGTALKLTIEEWIKTFEELPEIASLQLVNCVLWSAGIRNDMTGECLERGDPAAVMAEMQDEWEPTGTGEYPLAIKNKSKVGKAFRVNYPEFWKRWAAESLAMSQAENEKICQLVISWLLTMSSTGYRPLRHCATVAAYGSLWGCAQKCAKLSQELDRANRLAASRSAGGSAALVDQISAQVAFLEKIIQMVFDGVFVQRIRDVDPQIRHESIYYLSIWIHSYPDVFLDNAYLRYLGWSLSDRVASNRAETLAGLEGLYVVPALREGMGTFTDRFKSRLFEMVERDVESGVRNGAAKLLAKLLRLGVVEVGEIMGLVIDTVRYLDPLTVGQVELVEAVILGGETYEQAMQRLSELAGADSMATAPVYSHILGFLEQLLPKCSPERQLLTTEFFLSSLKHRLSCLKDLASLIRFPGEYEAVVSRRGKRGKSDWEKAFRVVGDYEHCYWCLVEACARFGTVYVNSSVTGAKDSRQLDPDGINTTHSRELTAVVGDALKSFCDSFDETSADTYCLEPIFDLVAMCHAESLLMTAEGSFFRPILGMIAACKTREGAAASCRLVKYWLKSGLQADTTLDYVNRLVAEAAAELGGLRGNFDESKTAANCRVFLLDAFARVGGVNLGGDDSGALKELYGQIRDLIMADSAGRTPLVVRTSLASLQSILLFLFETFFVKQSCQLSEFLRERDELFELFNTWISIPENDLHVYLTNLSLAGLSRLAVITRGLKSRSPDRSLPPALERGEELILFTDSCMKSYLAEGSDPVTAALRQVASQALASVAAIIGSEMLAIEFAADLLKWFGVLRSTSFTNFFLYVWNVVVKGQPGKCVQIMTTSIVKALAEVRELLRFEVFLEAQTAFVQAIVEFLKKDPSLACSEALIEMHTRVVNSVAQWEDKNAASVYLDSVLSHTVILFNPNISVEVCALVKGALGQHQIQGGRYLQTLERQASRIRKVQPARRPANTRKAGKSKLKLEIAAGGEPSGSDQHDGEEEEDVQEPRPADLSSLQATPIKEMAGLAMSSTPAEMSSPIQKLRRKRTIQY